VIHVHLLRLETVIKMHQTAKFPDSTDSSVLSKAEILRYAKDSEDAVRAILRTFFLTDNWPILPHNSLIMLLEAPSRMGNDPVATTGTSSTAAAQSWVYTTLASNGTTGGDGANAPSITTHGYLLSAGVSIALHMHVCLARLHIALSSMNDAKIHLRSALDLYTRYLKPIELHCAGDMHCKDVTEISALVPLLGTLSVTAGDAKSLRSQIGRQHRIVMDVLVSTSFFVFLWLRVKSGSRYNCGPSKYNAPLRLTFYVRYAMYVDTGGILLQSQELHRRVERPLWQRVGAAAANARGTGPPR
jgi:hypothetical protein